MVRKSKFTPEQILQALRQAEGGTAVVDIRRRLGVTEATFYRWKKPYTGVDVSKLRNLKQLSRQPHGKCSLATPCARR
jgi:putative transposase